MSRHRNVRSMNYSEEYEGYDDVYGHSVEDDYTISPSDAAFMYDRTNKPQMSAFFTEDDIAEEDENAEVSREKICGEPDINKLQNMNEEDRVRLQSCLDEIRNVIGDSIPEHTVIKKILAFDFDVNKTLDAVLSEATANTQSKPEDFRPAEPIPRTEKDDKTTLQNIEENLKQINLSEDPVRSLEDLASSCSAKESQFGSNLKDELGSKLPSVGAPVSNPFDISTPHQTGFLSLECGSGLKLPTFDAPVTVVSIPETNQSSLSLSDLASTHFKMSAGLPKFPFDNSEKLSIPSFESSKTEQIPDSILNFGGNEEMSLSALAAQHQSNLKSEHENTSLSSLAAEHLKNAADNSQSRFFIPRLSSPPSTKTERPFSPVFRGESPIEQNSEPIDLLSALNPPENRTKLEHRRVTWMDDDDDDDDEYNDFISCLSDPTCLLDCAAQGTLMDIDSTLSTDDSSPIGRVLCERVTSKRTFTYDIAAQYEGNLKRFLFDSPSPDDHILIRLGRKLPS